MLWGCSAHDFRRKCSLLYAACLTLSKWEKNAKIVDVNICLPEITDFFIKETTFAGHTMQMTQANNFEFGLMEIYKGVLFIGLS